MRMPPPPTLPSPHTSNITLKKQGRSFDPPPIVGPLCGFRTGRCLFAPPPLLQGVYIVSLQYPPFPLLHCLSLFLSSRSKLLRRFGGYRFPQKIHKKIVNLKLPVAPPPPKSPPSCSRYHPPPSFSSSPSSPCQPVRLGTEPTHPSKKKTTPRQEKNGTAAPFVSRPPSPLNLTTTALGLSDHTNAEQHADAF